VPLEQLCQHWHADALPAMRKPRLVAKLKSSIDARKFRRRPAGDRPSRVGGAVECWVVNDHHLAVA
jgi:hypothetical protein